ncbi:MAG: hypothetical protein ACLPVF_03160 [Acidimicrobiales bacterium]
MVEWMGAVFLMVVGVALTAVPSLALFTSLWSTRTSSLSLYIAALAASVALVGIGAILALITGESNRRAQLSAYQNELAMEQNEADRQRAIQQSRTDLKLAQGKRAADLYGQILQKMGGVTELPPTGPVAQLDDLLGLLKDSFE